MGFYERFILLQASDKFSGKYCEEYIELNPGPRSNSSQSSIFYGNLNSIGAHSFSKISLLKAYNTMHTYDICLSETYLNQDTLFDDDNLRIPGYELISVDHPSNQKRGGICIYHKDFFPIKVNNVSYLKECLSFNLSINGKQRNSVTYRLPNQLSEEFQTFLTLQYQMFTKRSHILK